MKSIKEIKDMFPGSFLSKNGECLCIKSCWIGDNYFGYGEEEKPLVWDDEYYFLANDSRIIVSTCDECCGCGDW